MKNANKNNPDLNESGWSIFDLFMDFELKHPHNLRKMTRDDANLQCGLVDETLLLGDRKFPLFDQY